MSVENTHTHAHTHAHTHTRTRDGTLVLLGQTALQLIIGLYSRRSVKGFLSGPTGHVTRREAVVPIDIVKNRRRIDRYFLLALTSRRAAILDLRRELILACGCLH